MEYRRALPSGAPVRAMTDDFGGRSCHMNSPSKPRVLPKLAPPPMTTCPPVLASVPTSPRGKPGPPPITKLYLDGSSCARALMQQQVRMIKVPIKHFFIM